MLAGAAMILFVAWMAIRWVIVNPLPYQDPEPSTTIG